MPHTYRVSLEEIGSDGQVTDSDSLTFQVTNHDDILKLVSRIGTNLFPRDEIAEFVVGLKLFSEVLLRHRGEPLFAELGPHMGAFMKKLKRAPQRD